MRSALISRLVMALALAGSASAAPAKRTVAVLALGGVGVPQEERVALEDSIRSALVGFDINVQARAKTTSAFRQVQALGLACDFGAVECLVRVGALGSVHVVISGAVSAVPNGYELELQGVDVVSMKEIARQRAGVPKQGPQRAQQLEGILTALLRPDAWRGSLLVTVPIRGASIVVDGAPRGFSPLSESIPLTPGPHELYVGLEGFRSHRETVTIAYAQSFEAKVALIPGVSDEAPPFVIPGAIAPIVAAAPAEAAATPAVVETPRKRPLRIAFYDIELAGVPSRVGQVLGQYLVDELRKRERVSVLDGTEIRALVGGLDKGKGEDGKAIERCEEEACFAEVAEALGVDGVVVAQLTQIEGEVLFGLRRIDQQNQEVIASFIERVPAGTPVALLPLVGKSIQATFGDIPLRAGQEAGVDERAAQVMDPPPLSPLISGSLFTLAGAAAVATVAAAVVMGASAAEYSAAISSTRSATNGLAVPTLENESLVGAIERYDTARAIFVPSVLATFLLGGAGVATSFFTDWNNAGAAMGEGT